MFLAEMQETPTSLAAVAVRGRQAAETMASVR